MVELALHTVDDTQGCRRLSSAIHILPHIPLQEKASCNKHVVRVDSHIPDGSAALNLRYRRAFLSLHPQNKGMARRVRDLKHRLPHSSTSALPGPGRFLDADVGNPRTRTFEKAPDQPTLDLAPFHKAREYVATEKSPLSHWTSFMALPKQNHLSELNFYMSEHSRYKKWCRFGPCGCA